MFCLLFYWIKNGKNVLSLSAYDWDHRNLWIFYCFPLFCCHPFRNWYNSFVLQVVAIIREYFERNKRTSINFGFVTERNRMKTLQETFQFNERKDFWKPRNYFILTKCNFPPVFTLYLWNFNFKADIKVFSISPRFVEARISQRWKVVETVHSVSVLFPRFFFHTELDYCKLANSYFRESLGYSKWKNRYISILIRMHCFFEWKVGNY